MMSSHAESNQIVSRIHWTARANFYLSFFMFIFGGYNALGIILPLPAFLNQWLFYFSFIVSIPALLLSCIALVVSRRPSWKEGREFALLGLFMSIVLCLRLVEYFYLQCCFRLTF